MSFCDRGISGGADRFHREDLEFLTCIRNELYLPPCCVRSGAASSWAWEESL